MDQAEAVQKLCVQHEDRLRSLAERVAARDGWDLNLPVAVIDARKAPSFFLETAVGTIGNVVRVSLTADHPLIKELFALYEDRGPEAALEFMLNEHVGGEEFSEIFEMYRQEKLEGSPLWGAEDAASFVVKSKEAFDDRELGVVALLLGEPHGIVTFGVPLAFYGAK